MKKLTSISVILVASLSMNPLAQGSRLGNLGATLAGGYVGGQIANRVAPDSPIAQIGGEVLGAIIGHRMYQNYEASQNRQVPVQESQAVSGDGVDDADYLAWRRQQSQEQLQAQTIAEYNKFRAANSKKISAARSSLVKKVKDLQSSQNPVYICAALCGGWNQYDLDAQPIVGSGNSARAAASALENSCPSDKILFNDLSSNDQGTDSISLQQSNQVCFLNQIKKTTLGEMIKDQPTNQAQTPVQLVFTDLKIQGATGQSAKFVNELLASFDVSTLFNITNGKTTVNGIQSIYDQHRSELETAFKSLSLVKNGQDDGIIILAKGSPNEQSYVQMTIHKNEDGSSDSAIEMPFAVDHDCNGKKLTEYGRVVANLNIQMGDIKPVEVSNNLTKLTLQNLDYSQSGEDSFCKKQ